MDRYTTREVAGLLGINYGNLMMMIARRTVSPPPLDASRRYVWAKKHVAAARQAIRARDAAHERRQKKKRAG